MLTLLNLPVSGKLQSGSALNVSDVGPHHQQLFRTDSNSGRCFLIDTVAQIYVIPATGREKQFPTTDQLQLANGTPITV